MELQNTASATADVPTEVIATTYTNNNGEFTFLYLPDGEYQIRTEENGLYTSVQNVTAIGSDPAPLTIEPLAASLPSTVDAPWNTALGMLNVAELSNNNDSEIIVTVTLRNAVGQTITSTPVALRPQSKFDYIISDLVPANTYGTVQFAVAGTSTDGFRCDIAHYRLAQGSSRRAVDFAFSIPCQVPAHGNTAVLTNKNFPGRSTTSRSVSNWLTLANLSDASRTYSVRSYSEDGLLLETKPIALNALTRFDLETSLLANITLVTVTPDIDSAPYLAVLSRSDSGDSSARSLAFGSHAQYGDSETRCVPISNLIGNESYTEMANVADAALVVSAVIYAADGSVVRPLDEEGVRAVARLIRADGAEAVAVSFIHAYANPAHEALARRILADELGDGVYLCCSHEVLPEIREYERTSTVVVNAYLGPVVRSYLSSLQKRLQEAGLRAPLQIMQS